MQKNDNPDYQKALEDMSSLLLGQMVQEEVGIIQGIIKPLMFLLMIKVIYY